MEVIYIQLQDQSGMWRTYHTTFNHDLIIANAMRSLKQNHPSLRVRAIDAWGRVIDLMV